MPCLQRLFDKALETFGVLGNESLALAVSGGADSMALALLALDFQKRHPNISLIAFVVNHHLRQNATNEAVLTCQRLKERGLKTILLDWEGEKPSSGIENAARKARYNLLEQACLKEKCSYLLLGHHKQDQAETYFIRKEKKSGPLGLAGMNAVRSCAFGKILRPLLGVNPQALKDLNKQQNLNWVEDETNHSDLFKRGQLRKTLSPQDISFGFEQTLLYGQQRKFIENQALHFAKNHASLSELGFILFSKEIFLTLEKQTQRHCLSSFLRLISNKNYPPSSSSLSRLLENMSAFNFKKVTLSGCCIAPTTKRQVLIWRELNDLPCEKKILNQQSFFWDRYSFFLSEPLTQEITIAPLKSAFCPQKGYPKQTFSSLPALFDKEGLFIVPHLEYKRKKTTCQAILKTPSFEQTFSDWICPIR